MNKILIGFGVFNLVFLSIIGINCKSVEKFDHELYPLQKLVPIPQITDAQKEKFNRDVKSDYTSIIKEDGTRMPGYKTENRIFLEEVITPLIKPYLAEISKMGQIEVINFFTLFNFEIYQRYFGRNFYRWGGDILDLDDPQENGTRSKFSFGLDCSGFVTSPYELAVYFGLKKGDEVLFSSKGFKAYCISNGFHDVGGREGTSNNFRLDTPELAELGKQVIKLEKGQIPTAEQIILLMSGDIVGRSGHFGIIAKINGEPYYFESGGFVVPKNNGVPVKAIEALKIFTSSGAIMVRRCLETNN